MSTPLWRQMYNAWEQAVSPPLQEVTASNGFRDLMAVAMKTNAGIAREIERSSRQWLHLWNLPAATDVRRLRQQVTGLEREVMALRHELERNGVDAVTTTGVAAPSKTADDGADMAMPTVTSTNGRTGRTTVA